MSNFPCEKCGLCCQRLHLNALYKDLDRGDGTCKYFDESTLLCAVYTQRPDICNIKTMHARHFSQQYSQAVFYALNQKACAEFQQNESEYEYKSNTPT